MDGAPGEWDAMVAFFFLKASVKGEQEKWKKPQKFILSLN